MILFEARADENGDPVLFDIEGKDRKHLTAMLEDKGGRA